MAAWRRILKWKEDLAARFCGANNEMFCQLTWWRALGITAQQRPASKMVRRERATPCSSSDLDQGFANSIFFLAFSVDMKTKGPFQNPLCLCLRFLFWDSLYGTQHISENGPGRRKKKKKKKSWQHPTCYRHLLADTRNCANDKTFLLFPISLEGRR